MRRQRAVLGRLGNPAPSFMHLRPWALTAFLVVLVVAGLRDGAAGGSGAPGLAADQAAHTQVAELAAAAPVATAPRQPLVGGLQLDMPKKPFAGQNLAPCVRGEREITLKNGSRTCWIGVTFDSETCKERGYEYQGGCYLPSYPPPKAPASSKP